MNSRCSDLVDHDPRNAGCSSSRRFLFPRLRGCRAWQGSRTRGRLTRPYRLTSASDLTRNSISFPGSSLLHFYFRIFPSRAAGDRERDVADHLGISGVTHFLVHKLANSIAQYFPFERFLFYFVYLRLHFQFITLVTRQFFLLQNRLSYNFGYQERIHHHNQLSNITSTSILHRLHPPNIYSLQTSINPL